MTTKKKEPQVKSVTINVTIDLGKGKKLKLDNDDARNLYFKLKEIYEKYNYYYPSIPFWTYTPYYIGNGTTSTYVNAGAATLTTTDSIDSITISNSSPQIEGTYTCNNITIDVKEEMH
jgi:hypothetical protein